MKISDDNLMIGGKFLANEALSKLEMPTMRVYLIKPAFGPKNWAGKT